MKPEEKLPNLIVTRDGVPCEDQAAALEEFKRKCMGAEKRALDIQHGGDHYKKLGEYQPVEVLKRWLTPEEFRGYMKGTAIVYFARERDKGGDVDIQKGIHQLQLFMELKD